MRRLWRGSGLQLGNLAGCILDATPEAADLRLPGPPILRARQPPSDDLFDRVGENLPPLPPSALYLGVEVRLDIKKDGTVAAPAMWLDQAVSSEGARSRWPALAPMIATCLEQGLASVRLAPGGPVDSSTVTLSVQVSKTEESWDLPDWLRPASRSGATPGAARWAWIGGASVLLGGILVAVVVTFRRRGARPPRST